MDGMRKGKSKYKLLKLIAKYENNDLDDQTFKVLI